MKNYDVIIIGAGAAGLMCGGKIKSASVLIIDSSSEIGKKLKISGGGKCNFTNKYLSDANYISHNPKFLKSVLSKFKPENITSLLDKYSISYGEKKLGQLFATTSLDIINMLKSELGDNVEFSLENIVEKIKKIDDGFEIKTSSGNFNCKKLVIATGGASYKNLGASDFALKLAQQFGIKYYEFTPALVPLTFSSWNDSLMGVSFKTQVCFNKICFVDDILFTHFGLSGPAVLQISSYVKQGENISVNFLPGENVKKLLMEIKKSDGKKSLWQIFSEKMPKKLLEFLLAGFDSKTSLNQMSDKILEAVAAKLSHFELKVAGNKGFDMAEVCLGGIDLNEIDNKFEVKKVKGLYFIGECLDITGQLGGFNIHNAFANGAICGEALNE